MADDQENRSGSGGAWLYLAGAMQFTTSPIAGGAVGYFADKYFHTAPTLALIGFVLGFIGGTINLVKLLKVPTKTP
jgi:F0F1-type ATP synthase assembly protein I